jgi:hypothetical protein
MTAATGKPMNGDRSPPPSSAAMKPVKMVVLKNGIMTMNPAQ